MSSSTSDLRLAFPLLALWIGSLGCFAVVGHLPLIVALAIGLLGLVVSRDPTRSHAAATVALVAIGAALALANWRVDHNDATTEVLANAPIADVIFRVSGDPSIGESRGFSALSFTQEIRFTAEVTQIDRRRVSIPVFISSDANFEPRMSEMWRCAASLRPADGAVRFAAFLRCRDEPHLVRSAVRYQAAATSLRDALQTVTAGRHPTVEGAQLLPGLVFGDTSTQTPAITRALQVSGLGHLTAVSGANVAIVVGAVAWLLRLTGLRPRSRYFLLLVTVAAFTVVARPSASVVRASVMAAIALTVWVTGAQKRAEAAVLAAAIVLLLIDPWLALSWGFALSVAATLGLVVLPRMWGIDADTPTWKRAVAAAASASLATTPLLIAMGAAPTFATIPANVLADVLVAPATILGVIAAVTAAMHLTPIAMLIADAAVMFAHAIVWIAQTFSDSWLAVSLISWQGCALAAAAIWLWREHGRLSRSHLLRGGVVAAALGTLLLAIRPPGAWPPGDWELYVCDVGQGDAALINTGNRSAIVVDAGPDAELVDRCLSAAGVDRISLFVASHFHQDHVGGVAGLARHGRHIERVLTSRLAQPAMGRALVASASGVAADVATSGMNASLGNVAWRVLMAQLPESSATDGTAINASSVVLLVHTAHWRILFTGDIETDAQSALMASISAPAIDLIKVPHHGSRSQSSDFAQWSRAAAAWVSVGADNPYGHPNLGTLAAYRAAGATVLLTRDCGAIVAMPEHTLRTERTCGVG